MTPGEALAKLQAAVTEYYRDQYPDIFVDDWALVTHCQSVELEAANQTRIHLLTPEGTPHYRVVGLLRGAL